MTITKYLEIDTVHFNYIFIIQLCKEYLVIHIFVKKKIVFCKMQFGS